MTTSSSSKGFRAGLKKLFRPNSSPDQVSGSVQTFQTWAKTAPSAQPAIEPNEVERDGYIRLKPETDEFRLLKVEGKGFASSYGEVAACPIDGQLEIYNLQNCPPYLALSYEWGDPAQARIVNTAGRLLNLQENLIQLLDALAKLYSNRSFGRSHSEPPPAKYLWVDQICINQRSKSERSSQVKMMGDIYRNALSVVAWPGYVLEYHRPSHSGPNMMLEVEKFLRARYWGRLWIVQEAMLAKEILTLFKIVSRDDERDGSSRMPIQDGEPALQPWSKLMDSLEEFTSSRKLLQEASRHFKGITAHRAADTRSQLLPLMDAISQFSDSGCLDPRDKVYGLLGIVQPSQRIEVNYRSSAEQVFEAAVNMVRANESRDDGQDHKQRIVLSFLAGDMGVRFIEESGSDKVGAKLDIAPDERIGSAGTYQRRNSFG